MDGSIRRGHGTGKEGLIGPCRPQDTFHAALDPAQLPLTPYSSPDLASVACGWGHMVGFNSLEFFVESI